MPKDTTHRPLMWRQDSHQSVIQNVTVTTTHTGSHQPALQSAIITTARTNTHQLALQNTTLTTARTDSQQLGLQNAIFTTARADSHQLAMIQNTTLSATRTSDYHQPALQSATLTATRTDPRVGIQFFAARTMTVYHSHSVNVYNPILYHNYLLWRSVANQQMWNNLLNQNSPLSSSSTSPVYPSLSIHPNVSMNGQSLYSPSLLSYSATHVYPSLSIQPNISSNNHSLYVPSLTYSTASSLSSSSTSAIHPPLSIQSNVSLNGQRLYVPHISTFHYSSLAASAHVTQPLSLRPNNLLNDTSSTENNNTNASDQSANALPQAETYQFLTGVGGGSLPSTSANWTGENTIWTYADRLFRRNDPWNK